MEPVNPIRVRTLPNHGTAIVNTDLHGNLRDFKTLQSIYEEKKKVSENVYWLVLGDLVHGPDARARLRRPDLYDYDDESIEIVISLQELMQQDPNILFVIGNHDHAHIGGPLTRKFHDDESAFLEDRATDGERQKIAEFFHHALLAVFAPCGISFSHASPGRAFHALEEFNIDFGDPTHQEVEALRHLLRCYGQSEVDSRLYLESVSKLLGFDLRVVVHGHDRDEVGYFTQEATQFCPVIFGAPEENKRFLEIDLASSFLTADSLKTSLRHLYP